MNSNPDPSKQSQELLFSQKKQVPNETHHWTFDNPILLQKHLRFFLNVKVSFDEHIQCISNKANKIIRPIRTMQPVLPRAALLRICKSLLKPHFDYGDVIYDRAFK